MNTIVSKRFFSENVAEIVIEAPLIARSRRAGHFVIVRVDKNGERMPLTIADADVEKGTITLVVQRIGVSSSKLCALEPGDQVADLVGPLGKATDIKNFGSNSFSALRKGNLATASAERDILVLLPNGDSLFFDSA
mgnify:CR=1 FL=1